MSQKYVEIWEASKSSRNVLNLRMYCQLKVYDWVFLVGFGCWGVLNTTSIRVRVEKKDLFIMLIMLNISQQQANIIIQIFPLHVR